jgi:succinate dehydrogenase / fumarate reductase, cytochrome b subunit
MSTVAASPAAIPRDHSFFWRRLHSLTGIVPVGAFLLEHFFSNAFALRGPAAYNDQVRFLVGLPVVLGFEIFLIYIPILYHGLYGVYIWLRGEPNMLQHSYAGNWMYTLQRWSGLLVFAYILFHTYEQRFTGVHLPSHPEMAFEKVRASLTRPWVVWFYVAGITASCFHFAYGLWLFGCKWGITPGPRAQKVAALVCAAIGVGLIAVGLATLRVFLV